MNKETKNSTSLSSILELGNEIYFTLPSLSTSKDSFKSSHGSSEWFSRRDNYYSVLPKNILIYIFSYLTEIEISRSVLRVCRHWRLAGKDPSLWKTLLFKNDEVDQIVICRLLRNAPKLECLKLFFMSNVKMIIRQLCRSNKSIKHLTLRFCNDEEILPHSVLCNILISCQDLQTLDLKGTQFSSKNFYEELATCKTIRSINFSENPFVTVNDLFKIVFNCHLLEELKLVNKAYKKHSLPITDEDAILLFSNLECTLKVLKIDCLELSTTGFESILKCSNLEKICLMNATNFSSILFRNLCGYLPKLKSLKLLKAAQITTIDYVYLFTEGKDVMKNLTVLDITGSWKLRDRGLNAIIKCCNSNLQKLILQNCKNIEDITKIYDECTNLQYLNIAFCTKLNVTKQLINLPNYLTKLHTLVIDNNNDNVSTIKRISTMYQNTLRIFIIMSEYNSNIS